MRARIQEVKECYEGWLTEEPDLGGRLVVSFAIEASGDGSARIREARIQGLGLGHRALESCVLVMVESLQFEAPPKGRVEVSYPFFFAPRKE
jgi:outer membrane biosynthesis protein TonB